MSRNGAATGCHDCGLFPGTGLDMICPGINGSKACGKCKESKPHAKNNHCPKIPGFVCPACVRLNKDKEAAP